MNCRDALKELRCYRVLKLDIKECQNRIHAISNGVIHSMTFNTSGVSNSPAAENRTENKYINIIEERDRLSRRIAEDEERIKRIENYISRIYDKLTRYIFEQHIYRGRTFGEIARKLDDRPTEDGIKRRVYRTLEDKPFTKRLDFDFDSLFD